MTDHISDGLVELLKEVKETREALAQQDAARLAALEELKANVAKHSKSAGDTEAKVQRIVDVMESLRDLTAGFATRLATLEDKVAMRERNGNETVRFLR